MRALKTFHRRSDPGPAAERLRGRAPWSDDTGNACAQQTIRLVRGRPGAVQAICIQPDSGRRTASQQSPGRDRCDRHLARRWPRRRDRWRPRCGDGAGAGALGGTAVGAGPAQGAQASLQQRYNLAYAQCMYSRGNQVPGFAPAGARPSASAAGLCAPWRAPSASAAGLCAGLSPTAPAAGLLIANHRGLITILFDRRVTLSGSATPLALSRWGFAPNR